MKVPVELLREYVAEAAAVGGDIADCEENVEVLARFAEEIQSGVREGVVVCFPESSFSMAIQAPSIGIRGANGKTAMGVGTYVRQKYRRGGVATSLRKLLINRLKAAGFERLIGTVAVGNAAGIESMRGIAEPQDIVFTLDLRGR